MYFVLQLNGTFFFEVKWKNTDIKKSLCWLGLWDVDLLIWVLVLISLGECLRYIMLVRLGIWIMRLSSLVVFGLLHLRFRLSLTVPLVQFVKDKHNPSDHQKQLYIGNNLCWR